MNGPLGCRLSKLEEIRGRNDEGSDVDMSLEKMGTSRAAMLADFGSLTAFRNWLAARIAATNYQAGAPVASLCYRKRCCNESA